MAETPAPHDIARHLVHLEVERRLAPRTLGLLVLAVFASVAVCHGFAQGGFYWLSDSVANPTVAGWASNYAHWFLPYLRTTTVYVALAAVAHVLVLQLRASTAAVTAR